MSASALVGVSMLAGCTGADVSRAFGLTRDVPDEYTVTTRPPLSMPPSESLGAPGSTTMASSVDQSPRMQALETLSPNAALNNTNGSSSAGQSALVGAVNQGASAPNNAELSPAGAGFVDNLMFWQAGSAGSVVDGQAENGRIRQNAALGRAQTNGATPTVRGKSSGGMLGIF
ncbi:hypothetical protein Tasa_048_166 [Tanticharoenia sakaeratensis NBRC 103193]|uniref:DUF3035 domain-containing protein n=2 Tax=Tanticharoenia TaxID=444052 RepID=A0A0D6MQ12_9PROT|nr:DUF3035 domain-containing protein [Tanticharoenia sakaeratensis]GAN55541.1 hypothetical protein Tasa_048_166 [Tanticharoenia sakaeratensis NBRC 103193]